MGVDRAQNGHELFWQTYINTPQRYELAPTKTMANLCTCALQHIQNYQIKTLSLTSGEQVTANTLCDCANAAVTLVPEAAFVL